MTSSMRRCLDAFDFKDEDGLPEIAARKFNAKFEKPNDNAIAKYKLVAAVDQRNIFLKKVPENVVSDDLEEIGCDHDNGKNVKKDAMWFSYSKIVNNDFDKHSKDSYWSVSPLPSYEEKTILKNRISRNVFYDEEMKLPSPSAHVGQSVNALLDSPGSVELSDEDLSAERIEEYDAVSTSDSDSLEDDDIPNDHVSNGWSSGSEMEHMEESIVVTCDYIIYQGNYYSALLVLFSPAGIKISSSDECGTKRFFGIRWNIDDIVSVKCQWFSRELQR